MKMYKGFDKDLKCSDFQYEIGKTYEEPTAELCEKGFHACEYPLDVFKYFAPGNMSRYCEVDLDEVSGKKDVEDSKHCGKKIAVKAEIGIAGIAKAAVDFVMENIGDENKETNTGNCSASTNTGFRSASTNTGFRSASTNTGDYSTSTNTGDFSKADVSGKGSVAAALGIASKAKGVLGCWLVLAEWDKDENYNWHRKDVQCFKVDGETVKPNTWYTLKDGRPVEVDE